MRRAEIDGQEVDVGSGQIAEGYDVRAAAGGDRDVLDVVDQEALNSPGSVGAFEQDLERAIVQDLAQGEVIACLDGADNTGLKGAFGQLEAAADGQTVGVTRKTGVFDEDVGALPRRPDEGIAAAAADVLVITETAVEAVVVGATVQGIVAVAADQIVVAGAALQTVVVGATDQAVIATVAAQEGNATAGIRQDVVSTAAGEVHVGQHLIVDHDLVVAAAAGRNDVGDALEALLDALDPLAILEDQELDQ